MVLVQAAWLLVTRSIYVRVNEAFLMQNYSITRCFVYRLKAKQ